MPEARMRSAKSSRDRLTLTVASLALIASIASLVFSIIVYTHPQQVVVYRNATNTTKVLPHYNITGALLSPQTSLSGYPIITANQPFGKRLTNINAPLNSTELSVINNAPNAYFQTAGNMVLNGTIPLCSQQYPNFCVVLQNNKVPAFVVNGKPSVIYLGSITCIYCGENRWAMALALGRFGNFTYLFKGYSSLGDRDVPTLYWRPASYNTSGTDAGAFYSGRYINFIAIEDTNPITGGFVLNPLGTMQKNVNATGNTAYKDAMQYIIDINNFGGTPYTIWGSFQNGGADGVDFGTITSSTLQLTNMTHEQVLGQLEAFNNSFAYVDYAAADVYIAQICGTIGNTAAVCSLPAIKSIETAEGY